MTRLLAIGLTAWTLAGAVAHAATLAPPRETISLDGTWRFCTDENNTGLRRQWHMRAPRTQPIRVPSCWEEYPQWASYDGLAWYFRTIAVAPPRSGQRTTLRFEAVNYRAEVYVDGTLAGQHEGGYTPFEVDLAEALSTPPRRSEGYLLAVRVLDPPERGRADGLSLADVPHGREHLGTNFGGIWQSVSLRVEPAARVANVFVQPHAQPRRLEVQALFEGPLAGLRTVHRVLAPDSEEPLISSQPAMPGDSPVWLDLPESVRLWAPEDPALYRLRTALVRGDGTEVDRVETRFGVRQFEARDGRFVLNGRPMALRMVALECVYPLSLVRPPSADVVEQDLASVRALGFNAVRVIGRPAPVELLDAADRLGVLVEEEPPLSEISDPERAAEHYRREVTELVSRDRNHPSVVLWSLMRAGPDEHALLGGLAALAWSLDPSRVVMGNRGAREAALLLTPGLADPLPIVDVRVRPSAPLSQDELTRLAALRPPASDGLVFVSEIGYGGLPDFREVAQRYTKVSHGHGLMSADRDAVLTLGSDIDRLLGAFRFRLPGPTGLDSAARRVDHFYSASQEAQAEVLCGALGALRANAEVDGFCVRQWDEDARTAGQGLATLFRQRKAVCGALESALAPRAAFVLADTPTVVRTQPAEASVALVNDTEVDALCHVRLEAISPTNERRRLADESVTVAAWGRAAVRGSFEPYATGRWRIRAETGFEGDAPRVGEGSVWVLSEADPPTTRMPVTLLARSAAMEALLSATGIAWQPFDAQVSRPEVIVVPRLLPDEGTPFVELAEAELLAARGCTVVYMAQDDAAVYGVPVTLTPTLGADWGSHTLLPEHPLLEGLTDAPMLSLDRGLADLAPRRIAQWDTSLPVEPVLPYLDIRPPSLRGGGSGGLVWGAGLATEQRGAGQRVYCQLECESRPESPVVRRFVANLLWWAERSLPLQLSTVSAEDQTAYQSRMAAALRARQEHYADVLVSRRVRAAKDTVLDHAFEPEQALALGLRANQAVPGIAETVSFSRTPARLRGNLLEVDLPLAGEVGADEEAAVYVLAYFHVPAAAKVRLRVDGAWAFRTWIDGSPGPVSNRSAELELKAGWHELLAKVVVGAEPERLALAIEPAERPTAPPVGVGQLALETRRRPGADEPPGAGRGTRLRGAEGLRHSWRMDRPSTGLYDLWVHYAADENSRMAIAVDGYEQEAAASSTGGIGTHRWLKVGVIPIGADLGIRYASEPAGDPPAVPPQTEVELRGIRGSLSVDRVLLIGDGSSPPPD